ncbi:hypothetical protein IW261DRAFT_1461706 [Armillaria novae-zelandiae]|uniref:Uncharacterized protein n=1 Tax=Armillaria novae-zelandiae TaxID=153914 RepID=A0AA39UHT1_9AGAR|nr:hypothetical protein IW261DRAFT_1461706 [Armillaria novae-zelandiae]
MLCCPRRLFTTPVTFVLLPSCLQSPFSVSCISYTFDIHWTGNNKSDSQSEPIDVFTVIIFLKVLSFVFKFPWLASCGTSSSSWFRDRKYKGKLWLAERVIRERDQRQE